MGSARVGQIDVVVARMIPVANVEAKVRHTAVVLWHHKNLILGIGGLFVWLPELGRGAPRISKRSYVVKTAPE